MSETVMTIEIKVTIKAVSPPTIFLMPRISETWQLPIPEIYALDTLVTPIEPVIDNSLSDSVSYYTLSQ